jgi:hypothetical protein
MQMNGWMDAAVDFKPEIDLAKYFPQSKVQIDLLAHFSVADSRHGEL